MKGSPKFEKPLTDTTGIEGYPARLEVKVEGRPKPDVKWTKAGQIIRPDDHHIKLYAGGDGTHAIIFDNCTADDSGMSDDQVNLNENQLSLI